MGLMTLRGKEFILGGLRGKEFISITVLLKVLCEVLQYLEHNCWVTNDTILMSANTELPANPSYYA